MPSVSEQPPSPGERLDSWKAIAEYLQRDVATVARWQKNLGLPVRRVGGSGRSVFAYTTEIDKWLQTARPPLAAPDLDLPPATATRRPAAARRGGVYQWRRLVSLLAVLALGVAGLFAWLRPSRADNLRVDLTSAGLIARDMAGVERWRHPFPTTYKTFMATAASDPVQVIGGRRPGVYFITSYRGRQMEDEVEGGVLTLLDPQGRLQRSFAFDDRVTFDAKTYGPPWALQSFDVNEADGTYRVALAAHHYTWDPGIVTILDDQWQRRGTFVHAGWIEQVRWLSATRLVIGGFSNAHDGGMVALLDATALNGQGPEPAGTAHFCETCGADRPLRMFVFPRTEINRVTASRFNRTVVQTLGDRVIARTIEVPRGLDGDADALYEFTPAFDFVAARFGERYWEVHRELEAEGRITHRRDQCPDRGGPREVRMWEPATGWRTVHVP